MALTSGTVIGQYRIDRELGAGGMGEVYKATHLVLGREVALKTLRSSEAPSNSSFLRFVQEARAASALHNLNIVAVYDVVDVEGTLFIAMEYVEGETLQKILSQRALRLNEVIRYAIQIAKGLAAAHAAGILHRDIKPSNIMITSKNVVKLLDFGIAKRFDARESHHDGSTRTMPADALLTREGHVAGTSAYMSPEQIQGLRVDARSDIFSFGIVLYQMLTRKNPFAASSTAVTTARILQSEVPPLIDLVPDIPDELGDVVRFCLLKNPEERAHSMHDIAHMLEMAERSLERPHTTARKMTPRWRSWLLTAALAALVFVTGWGVGAFLVALRGTAGRPRLALRRITWDAGLSRAPVLSNDGHLLAFASDRTDGKNLDIFVRYLSGGEPIRLTSDPADDEDPSLSPDGSTIAFRSERRGGGIYLIPSFGGPERLIAPQGNNPQFSPDGNWIAYWVGEWANNTPPAQMFVVPATGGIPRRLQPAFADARFPVWTPDGAHILFQGVDVAKPGTDPRPDWWVTTLDSGRPAKTGAFESFAQAGLSFIYPPGGWRGNKLVFSAQDDMARFVFEIPISLRTWRAQGPPESLTFGTGIDGDPYPSPTGAIAFTSFQYGINVWSRRVDESGRIKDKEPQKLTTGSAFHSSPSMDARGTRLVFLLGRTPSHNVWIRSLATGRQAPVTIDAADKCSAVISGNGSRVAWSLCGPNQQPVYLATVNGDLSVSVPEKVCDDCGRVLDWSQDGDSILFVDHSRPVRAGIFSLSSQVRTMIGSPRYSFNDPRLSPDGNWIALAGTHTQNNGAQIFAIPLQSGKPMPESTWVAVTNGDFWDDRPVWTERGDALLFYSKRDGFGCLWRQSLNRMTKRPEGLPQEIMAFHSGRLSIKDMVPSSTSMSLVSNQLLFNALEWTGSIWLMVDSKKPGAGHGLQ